MRPDTWALKAAMLLHHVFVGPIALVLIFRDPVVYGALSCFGCDEYAQLLVRDPDVQVPPAIVWLVPVTVGYMVADLCLIGCWDLSGKGSRLESALMVVHHVLSIITWPHTIWYDFCARYVLFLVAYELSSIFLTLNWMLSTAGKKQDSAYFASGLLFTASFVAVRLAGGLPQIVAMWNAPPWRHLSGVPDYVWMGSVVLVLPHVLNFFWGVKAATLFFPSASASHRVRRRISHRRTISGAGAADSLCPTHVARTWQSGGSTRAHSHFNGAKPSHHR